MAARHIASLPNNVQVRLLRDTFWNIRYHNTWVMYVGITGGSTFAFKHYLSGNLFPLSSRLFGISSISRRILNNKIKCLYLLHCLAEADHRMLPSFENIFHGGIIDLSHQSLLPNDVHTLAFLLLRSPNKQWEMINLSHCNIDSKCCDVLWEMFHSQSITVKTVDISHNDLTWESVNKLSDVLRLWKINELVVSVDSFYDRATLKVIISFTRKLLSAIEVDPLGSNLLVSYIPEKDKVILVFSNKNYITCKQCNNCCLNDNMIDVLKSFTRQMNIKRIAHVDVSVVISDSDRKLSTLPTSIQNVTLYGSNLYSKGILGYSTNAIITFNHENFALVRTVADYLATVVHHSNQLDTSYLNAIPSNLAINIKNFLQQFTTMNTVSVNDNNINDKAAYDVAAVLSYHAKLKILDLGKNNLQAAGTIKIARALKNITTLTIFDMNNNNINDEAADDIAAVLSHNMELQQLELSGNNLQTAGAIKIARGLRNTTTLTIFDMENNNISDEAADDIATVLSRNTKLQQLYLGGNNLKTSGAIKIARALQCTTNLTIFCVQNNNIGCEAADDIAAV